jgi:predicted peptidase
MMTRTEKVLRGIGCLEYFPVVTPKGIIMFLHGMGERGPNTGYSYTRLETNPIPEQLKNGKEVPYIVVSPQLLEPATSWTAGQQNTLLDIIQDYCNQYNLTIKHITGLSLGGYTLLGMMPRALTKFGHNHFFTSAGVVCGLNNTTDMTSYLATPIKWWHGTLDGTNPYSNAVAFFNRLTAAGGVNGQLRTWTGYDHNVWDVTYNTSDEYWQWIATFETDTPSPTYAWVL